MTNPTDDLRRALVLDIVTCDDPPGRLLHHLGALDAQQDLASQAAVFEQVAARIDVVQFWILHRMHRVYAELGRPDLAFLVAALGARIPHEPRAAHALSRQMFHYHRDRGEAHAAVAAFVQHAQRAPEQPVAERWEVEPLARAIGVSFDPPVLPASPGARRDHELHPDTVWTPERPASVGARLPVALAAMATPLQRHATIVTELPDAELFIRHDSLVTVDRDGNLQLDLSLGAFPQFVRERVAGDEAAQRLDLEEAVVVLDRFPSPNLCHFLLDHISRLGLYQAAGAELPDAVVIGARLHPGFQEALARRAPVGRWLFTDRVARVRVRRLWVSTECREVQHPAQLCAPWTLAWVRGLLDAADHPGTRRLFVSRADSTARALVNEAELLGPLERHGFEVIVPGRMPYEEQLAAFRGASHVVACHGAALAHLAACAPGTHVLEMFHPLYSTWAYAMLAQALGLRYAALVGRDGVSDDPALNDPDIAGPLRDRFGERGVRIDPAELTAWLEATA